MSVEGEIDAEQVEENELERSGPLDLTGDERRLVPQPCDLSVSSLVEDIEADRTLLRMEYQCSYIWDDATASRLIESLLLNADPGSSLQRERGWNARGC